jgi:acetyl esterase/lipase
MTFQPPAILSPTCILNGHSVHVEEAKAHIARISGEVAVQVQVVVTRRGDDISALVARALGEHRHPIVAGGGDGTVNAVAGKLAGTDTPLGVLPMGTLNHFAKDAGIPLNLLDDLAGQYLHGVEPRTLKASPLYADLHGLPPLLIQVGTAETLLDDATRLAARAGDANVRAILSVWPEMIHVWHLFHSRLRDARAAINEAGVWMRA